MYESAENNNGYKALKLHLEKINPKCNTFFQYLKSNVRPKKFFLGESAFDSLTDSVPVTLI